MYVPCVGSGLAAVDTRRRPHQGRAGTARPASAGSPVLGGGAVWVADWNSGTLYELAPGTGAVRQQISLGGPLPHFVSPSLSGGLSWSARMTGVTAVSGA